MGSRPAQRDAVLHGDGPLLIIAGAGTGKTTVLTRRIAHLIASKRARPEEILALTFTEKAAAEMSERVDQLIPYGYAETWIGTFHAFGDRVLREGALESGLNPEFQVLARPEQIIFLRERIFRLPLERFRPLGDPTHHLAALLDLVSRAKDEDVSPEAYVAWARDRVALADTPDEQDEAAKHQEVAAFYEAYQRLLAEAGLADFGDQIHQSLSLLRERPAALAKLRERYRYVLVDEFQDTNHAQLELVRLLAGEGTDAGGDGPGPHANGSGPNITVVGDDDQAIYRWRGAASANLLAFRRIYPGAREVVLNENHRSTQPILDAAARLISYNNPHRLEAVAGIDKRLRSERTRGPAVTHLRFDTVSAEADGVADLVQARLREGYRPRDLALLVRTNSDADPFLRALNVHGIAHRFSGSRGLYAREEVRLLIAFLRALANPADSISLFYLAASELYALPAPELLRLNHHARRKSRPLLEVLRGLPADEDLAGVSGAARESAARLLARPGDFRAGRRPPAHGRGALQVPAGLGPARPLVPRGERGGGGEGPQRRALLRYRARVRRGGRTRPGPGVRRAPGPAARGGRRSRGRGGGARRRRGQRVDGAQGQGPRVRRRVPGRLRAGPLPPAPPRRPAGAAGGARGGSGNRRRRAPAGGAPALLRRHDAREGRARAHLGCRLRHRAPAQALEVRGGSAGPALAAAAAAPEPGHGSARAAPAAAGAVGRAGPPPVRRPAHAVVPSDRRLRRPARSSTSTSTSGASRC